MMDFLSKIKGAMAGLAGPGGGFPPEGADPGAMMPPPGAAPPQAGGADPSQLMAAMGGMGAAPPMGMPPSQPNPMAQDVMNARRKFRMGRTGGGGAGGGGYTGMGGGVGRPMME